jgi:hypothetical protein
MGFLQQGLHVLEYYVAHRTGTEEGMDGSSLPVDLLVKSGQGTAWVI